MECGKCAGFVPKNVEFGVCKVMANVKRGWVTHKSAPCVVNQLLEARKELTRSAKKGEK